MKKFCAILLAALIPALSFAAVQYSNGTFVFDKDGVLNIVNNPSSTQGGMQPTFGYYVVPQGSDSYTADSLELNELSKKFNGNKTVSIEDVKAGTAYGFYIKRDENYYFSQSNLNTVGGNFSYDNTNGYFEGTLGSGNDKWLSFTLSGDVMTISIIDNNDQPTFGSPLPGTLTTIALCLGAIGTAKCFGKKKQGATKK